MGEGKKFEKGRPAEDGIHDSIEFNEFYRPSYWMLRRAVMALRENIAPIAICVGTLVAFVVIGYIEVHG